MDKSCQSGSAADSSSIISTTATCSAPVWSSSSISNGSTSNTNNLRQLNKLSHRISKPTLRKPTFDSSSSNDQQPPNLDHNQPKPLLLPAQNQQHQPPVYNVNKNDFREVVQRLTGSPAHERISTPPPPIQQPKQPSSRLQRIRPPPLAHISHRSPRLLNTTLLPPPQLPNLTAVPPIPSNPINAGPVANFSGLGKPIAPLSPLPPFPSVHAPAESPVSAYMRYLHNSMINTDSNPRPFSGFNPLVPPLSPRFNNFTAQPPPLQPQPLPPPEQQSQVATMPPAIPPPQPQFQLPPSPAPIGCLNSPKSPYPLLSPSLLLSPSSVQLWFPQLPLSPTVPAVPSPTWRGGI